MLNDFRLMEEADGDGAASGGAAGDEAAVTAAAKGNNDAGKENAGGKEDANATNNTDGGKQTGDAGKQGAGAPEKYEAFNMPEGMQLDEAVVGKFAPVAKELGLDQAGAQKMFDFSNRLVLDAVGEMADFHKQTVEGWQNEAKADKEIGGANFDANVALAKTGMEKTGGTDLVNLLEEYGLNAHPLIIRAFRDVGKMVSNDTVETGAQGKGRTEDDKLAARYPSMKK
jgi:hypothetical protein